MGWDEKMKIFGYIRTTITDEDPQPQMTSLQEFGCSEIFHEDYLNSESISLDEIIDQMESGDTLVVDQLYRLGKSTRQLADLMLRFQTNHFDLVCLTDTIDTRDSSGKLYFQWMNQMASMERALLKERTLLGLSRAREKGKIGGRPKTDAETVHKIRFLFFEKKESIQTIATTCQVSIGTCYKYIHLSESEIATLLQK